MYCRKCGKSIPEDSLFCPYCGCATGLTDAAAVAENNRSPEMRGTAGKRKAGVLSTAVKIASVVILVGAVAVCVLWGIRRLPSDNDTSVQDTVSTLPSATAPAQTGTAAAETAEPTREDTLSDPWLHCDTMEEAEQLLGFGLELPEMVKDFDAPFINAAPDCSNLWIIFRKDTLEHDPQNYNNIITVSKMFSVQKYPAAGSPYYDASVYDTKLVSIGGNDVVLLLDNGEVVEADWVADGYGYSVLLENCGLGAKSVAPVLAQIR